MAVDPRGSRRGLLKTAVSDIGRLGQISAVLMRHGFGQLAAQFDFTRSEPPADLAPEDLASDPSGTARRVRAVLEDLGPTFVKLGQVLSTRPDMLPPVFIRELSRLQDNAPPIAFEAIHAELEEILEGEASAVFEFIDPKPLAAGSIAQTHLARLYGGREVVVKVQRPDIERLIESDLDLLRFVAKVLEATVHEMGLYSPSAIVGEFERALLTELDFDLERHNLHLFRELYQDDPSIWVPEVIDEFSRRKVLVLELIPGVKITDIPPDTPRAHGLALRVIDLFYTMLFEHGVFHGDPHPGNVLVTEDDRIGLIDFGLTGRLTRSQQDTLIALIISVVSGDTDGIARAVLSIGRVEGRIPLRSFREDIVDIRTRYLQGALGEIDLSAFVLDLLDAGQRYRIQVPATWAILSKVTVSFEGIIRTLHPNLNLPVVLRPYAQRLLLQRYGPQRLSQTLLSGTMSIGGLVRELPSQLHQVMMDLE